MFFSANYYASTYVVPAPANPSLEYASSSLPVGLNTLCHDDRAGTQQPLHKAVYKNPDYESDLRSKKKGPVCANQPVYNQMEELSVRGPPLGPVQDHDNGTHNSGAHRGTPVGHQAYGHDNILESAGYRDPDFDSELRSKLIGRVCAEQPVYNHVEDLSVGGVKGPTKGRDNGSRQPVCTDVYKDPDLDSKLRPKTKGPACVQQLVYNHVEVLPARGAKGPAKGPTKGPENGSQQPVCTDVYKDPDLDSKLRPKTKGPACVQQLVYNHMEELPARGAKGPAKGPTKGPENGSQQPVYAGVYKDPDLDSGLRSKKKGPVCVQQPVYNHVEELPIREVRGAAKGPVKGPDNGNQQPVCTAVYKDPDLDKELRPKKKGRVCVQQPVYNHMEELSVTAAKRPTKRPTKGPDNGNQQPVCTAVYKDPDLDKELRPKKKGPVCVQQPVYNHVEELSAPGARGPVKARENDTHPECNALESYLEC